MWPIWRLLTWTVCLLVLLYSSFDTILITACIIMMSNEHHGVSNHRKLDCMLLLNSLFKRTKRHTKFDAPKYWPPRADNLQHRAPDLISWKRHHIVIGNLSNGSVAFKWKLHYQWLNSLRQRHDIFSHIRPSYVSPAIVGHDFSICYREVDSWTYSQFKSACIVNTVFEWMAPSDMFAFFFICRGYDIVVWRSWQKNDYKRFFVCR